MKQVKKRVVFIVGPTGSGKTELGLKLGGHLPCEFISADSMQIYKGMDIITDKLPEVIRRRHAYHLLDIVAPTREYNVADFCKSARKAIVKILKKRKLPVVIGGTGLYINCLLYGIFQAGEAKSSKVRTRLEALAKAKGSAFLYQRLKKVDAASAAKINIHDLRRIIRALEVYELTKKPISLLQKERRGLVDDYEIFIFGIRKLRQELYEAIELRVDCMVQSGLLNEVAGLLKKKLSKTAYYCIGMREVEGFLKGRYDFTEALRLIKRNTRRYAKRQLTWFNKNKDIEWLDLKRDDDLSVVAKEIFMKLKGRQCL